ncbi:hypothetical protein ACWDRX_36540 [Streptomyces nigra]
MESTETTQQIGSWTVRAVWTETGPFPSELHITTKEPGAAKYGITSHVLRSVNLVNPKPTASAMGAALDALREVRDCQSQGYGSEDDDYLIALAAAFVAMSKAGATEPVERMSYFLPDDCGTIWNHLTKAKELGFLEWGGGGWGLPSTPIQ